MDFDWIKKAQQDEQKIFYGLQGTDIPEEPKPTLTEEILTNASKIKRLKLGCNDPGRQRDAYGFVGLEYEYPRIKILGAQRWQGTKYLTVEEKITQIHHQFKFDYQLMEINSMGLHVWEVLKYVKNIPVIGINASKDLKHQPFERTDPDKFPSMDNNDVTRWMHLQHEMGNFIFPKKLTKELIELQDQVSNITEYRSEGTGSVTYKTEGQEHDDLFTALRLGCWFIKENLMKPQNGGPLIGAGGSYYREDIEPQDRIIETVKKRLGQDFHLEDVKIDFT